MKKLSIALTILFILLSGLAGFATVAPVELTSEEVSYLSKRGPIKLAVDPDWYPYEEIDDEGLYHGIAADILALVSERVGVIFEVVPTNSWDESLSLAKSGAVDALACLNQTEERDEWLLFTTPYLIDPSVIITRQTHDYISDLERFTDETIVLPEGTSIEEWVRNDYPGMQVIVVESEEKAIAYVDEQKADMTIRSLTMAAYIIKNEGYFNLKITGEVPGYDNQFKIGITKQDAILQTILNKGIASISEQEIQSIINRHISIEVVKGFDYKLFGVVVGGLTIVLCVGFYWLRKVQKLNAQLKSRQEELLALSERLMESEGNYKRIAEELESNNLLLKEVATVDPLTGLNNRYSYNQRILVEIERAKRYNTPLSLLILDMDHFKRINDTYGHQAGDEVIRKISEALQSIIRKVDSLARWGGEEFVVLLPGIGLKDASTVAEKLRQKVGSVVHFEKEIITVSIGVSTFSEQESMEAWFNRTDQALYHAKQEGRNRICLSASPELTHNEILEWKSEWESGNFGIDQQHKELLRSANTLIGMMMRNEKLETIKIQLDAVLSHIKRHFKYEEQMLSEVGYSELDAHKENHRQLLIMADEIIVRSNEGKLLISDVVRFVVGDVITMHLLKEDTKFFDLFSERKQNG
ncbi:MAG: diguanylate cyclase [Firmicutes bacterium]|nr:diguanylate cyclase [Bacillota bacterium]